jgi:hypothetical protein
MMIPLQMRQGINHEVHAANKVAAERPQEQ